MRLHPRPSSPTITLPPPFALTHGPPSSNFSRLSRSRLARLLLAILLVISLHRLLLSNFSEPDQKNIVKSNLNDQEESDFGSIDQVEGGRTVTFGSYLDELYERQKGNEGQREQLLWLTISNRHLVHSTTAVLAHFVESLNEDRPEGLEDRKGPGREGEVVLVVLCADAKCLEESARKNWRAYGGYRLMNPTEASTIDWIKLSGIVDALRAGFDVLYVDPDLVFTRDPRQVLYETFEASDLVATEDARNASSGFIGTNLIYSRNSQAVTDLWTRVLQRYASHEDSTTTLNSLLGSVEKRMAHSEERKLSSSFASFEGIKVKILNRTTISAWRPSHDAPLNEDVDWNGNDPIAVQLSCGGDSIVNDYIIKAKGLYPNIDEYYTSPPKVLLVPHLVGTRDDLKQIVKILITAAKLSGRALQLPQHTTFSDVISSSTRSPITLPSYAAFPFPYLASTLNFTLVEPHYAARAQYFLGQAEGNSTATILRSELEFTGELDLRNIDSLHNLIRKLSLISYSAEKVISLTHFDSLRANWRKWQLPRTTRIIQPCRRLEAPVLCGEVCRLPGSWMVEITEEEEKSEDRGELIVREMRKRVEEVWPTTREFLLDQDWTTRIDRLLD